MSIKKYNFTVTKTYEVEVKIDSDKINEDFLATFRTYMWDVEDEGDIANHIARCTAFDFDPEGVGLLKKWDESEEQQMSRWGFNSKVLYEDDEVDLSSE